VEEEIKALASKLAMIYSRIENMGGGGVGDELTFKGGCKAVSIQ